MRLLTTLLTEMDGMEEAQGAGATFGRCLERCRCRRVSCNTRVGAHGAGVLVLGTTNRPDAVDSALMRPGRFDTLLHVPPPDLAGRMQVRESFRAAHGAVGSAPRRAHARRTAQAAALAPRSQPQVLELHTRAMPLASDVDLAALAAATPHFTGAELAGLCREAALAALREDFEGAQHVAARHFEQARAASNAPATSPLALAALAQWAEGRRRRPVGGGAGASAAPQFA